jgi:ribokinase
MKHPSHDIVILLSSVTELIFDLPRMLRVGETLCGNFSVGHGGKGLNMAVATRRLGHSPAVIGRLGTDAHSEAAIDFLAREGLDISRLVRDPAGGSAGVIFRMPDGANAIAIDAGANMRLSVDDIDRHAEVFRRAKVVLAPLELPQSAIARAFQHAREGAAITILNPAPAPIGPIDPALLDVCDILTPNQHEAVHLSGHSGESNATLLASATSLSQGRRHVLLTAGERGALIVDRAGTHAWVPPPVVKVLDTSGAGDAFNGGLAVALAEGKPLADAARFAVTVASLKCTRHGTSVAMPMRNEVQG